MVNYECFRCGYSNNIKTIFINHLNRKFTCKPKIKDITIEEIYNNYFNKEKKIFTPNDSKMTPNDSKITPNDSKMTPKKTIKKSACEYCNINFTRKSNLIRHYKRCKVKKDKNDYLDLKKLVKLLNDQLKEQKKELKKELKEKDKQIFELMKKVGVNIGTQNIQQNIKILAYNKTDMTHLKDKDYLKFMNHSNFCVPHMIKKLHFDPRKPENHNIYISNLKNNFVMVYNGDQWNIRDRNEVINDMIEDNTNILEDKIEDWLEKGKQYPQIMKKFNRYLEKKENNVVLDKIKQEIKFILYNNRKVVNDECC